MRHNQNSRHTRGRRGNNHHSSGGGNNGGNNGGGQHGQRRVNPRVQSFDSNGPDVRIRGNAAQITEKYQTLARDAASSGDRILAESYYQHAEHYQRMINEMNDDYARQNPGQPQQSQGQGGNNGQHNEDDEQPQPHQPHQHQQRSVDPGEQPQPSIEGMDDLDQGFLVGPRGRTKEQESAPAEDETATQDSSPKRAQKQPARQRESEAV